MCWSVDPLLPGAILTCQDELRGAEGAGGGDPLHGAVLARGGRLDGPRHGEGLRRPGRGGGQRLQLRLRGHGAAVVGAVAEGGGGVAGPHGGRGGVGDDGRGRGLTAIHALTGQALSQRLVGELRLGARRHLPGKQREVALGEGSAGGLSHRSTGLDGHGRGEGQRARGADVVGGELHWRH